MLHRRFTGLQRLAFLLALELTDLLPSSSSCSFPSPPSEILDFGYPQNSEIDTLKMYITTEGVKSELSVVSHLLLNSIERPLPLPLPPPLSSNPLNLPANLS